MKKYFLLILIISILSISCKDKIAQPVSQSFVGTNKAVIALIVYNGKLIAGGYFTSAGNIQANHIAQWNGHSWSSMGYTGSDSITAFTIWNGNLIAGTSDGNIYQWNGAIWTSLRIDTNRYRDIIAMTSYNGNLFACGFTQGKLGISPFLEEWDGNKWSDLGPFSHRFFDQVASMINYNGNLVIAGQFDSIGGISAKNIAQFNGSTWSPLGTGMSSSIIFSMCIYNGILIVSAYNNENDSNLAQWNGNAWVQIANPFNLGIYTVTTYNGNLMASGDYYDTREWNGTAWTSIGSGNYTADEWPNSLIVWNGNLYIAGMITAINGITVNNIAEWNGSSWSALQ